MVDGMYKKFNVEYGFMLLLLLCFLGMCYDVDLKEMLMFVYNYFGVFSFLMCLKLQFVYGVFLMVVSCVLDIFQDMNCDIEIWLKLVMMLFEVQVCDYQK